MIVETHSHIRLELPGDGEPTFDPYGRAIEDVPQYLASYEANGIEKCWVFGQRSWRDNALTEVENDALAQLGSDHAGRLYPWGSVNPEWPESKLRAEIVRMRELRLTGIKLVPIVQGFSLSSGGADAMADEAARQGLPVFLHDGSPEYCSAIQTVYFARKHPDLRVVSGHGGLRELWPDLIPAVRELPNLWVCLSGPTQWGIQRLYDELGPSKLMFGSDGGLGHPAVIRAYLRRIARLRAPEEDKAMILGGAALRFIGEA